jgi:alpha-L-fucosidase
LPEGEKLPEVIEWKGNLPKGNMKLLKGNKRVKYVLKGDKVEVTLPKGIENEPIALSFVLKK